MAAATSKPPTLDLDALIQVTPPSPQFAIVHLHFPRVSPHASDAESVAADAIPYCPSAGTWLLCPTLRVLLTLSGNAPKPAWNACSTTTGAISCYREGEQTRLVLELVLRHA